jgi:hypothetical protein
MGDVRWWPSLTRLWTSTLTGDGRQLIPGRPLSLSLSRSPFCSLSFVLATRCANPVHFFRTNNKVKQPGIRGHEDDDEEEEEQEEEDGDASF